MSTTSTRTQGGAPSRPDVLTLPWGERLSAFVVRWGFIAVTITLIGFFTVVNPSFLAPDSIFGVLRLVAPIGIAGLGVMLTLTVTGIDLSVGSAAGFAVSVAAWTMVVGNQMGGIAILVVMLGGLAIGLLNSVLILVAKIPDLLATLATMFVVVGLKLLIVDGKSISSNMTLADGSTAAGSFTNDFLALDRGSIGPVPVPVIIFAVLTLALWFILEKTTWGRVLYAIGANQEATRLAGIRVKLYRTAAYVGCSLLASLAGLLLAARIGQGDVSAGGSLLLDAIAVALVSVSVLGLGRPNAWGTALGAVLIGVMTTGFTMVGLPYYAQDLGKGVVLVVALLFSFTLSKKRTNIVAGSVSTGG